MTADDVEPDVIDLRNILPPAGDQGQRGTCVAFALTALHTAAIASKDEQLALSEEFLFWAAKKRDGHPGDGTTYRAAVRGLSHDGQCRAEHWPYDDATSHDESDYSPSAAATADAQSRTANGRDHAAAVDEVRRALLDGSLIAIAIPVWPDFDAADGSSVASLPPNIDQLPLEHAVVIAGHDSTQNAVLIRNSWGPKWGEDGYAWFEDRILDAAKPLRAWTLKLSTSATRT